VALQGQVIETGIAFILTLDYNKSASYFKSKAIKEKSKEIRKLHYHYENKVPILYILFLIILVYGCGGTQHARR
jgi:hypothetical protein